MNKYVSRILVAAGFVLTAVLLAPATATAQDIGELDDRVDGFDERIDDLEKRYLKPAMLAAKYKLEARFNDAKVAYFMQDYQRAAILFVDVVQDEKFRRFESYREALFLLGDSLYQLRNYLAARNYFRQLLELGPGSYYQDAAGRLLEIAYKTRNFDNVDEIHAKLQSAGNVSSALSYLSGKAFYQKGEYDKAIQSFARAAEGSQYRNVATYFMGVTYAADEQFDRAEQAFEKVVNTDVVETQRDQEIVRLAYLALGRVAYEKGDVEQAIDYYGHIPRASIHFDRALWEQTWALVSKERWEAARRNVDILKNFEDPDPDLLARAKLLRADLSLRMGEYDVARTDYQEVLDTFTPVAEQMEEFATRHDDLPAFFTSLVNEELAGAEPEYMPPLVKEWVESDPDMKRASQALDDVRAIDQDIRGAFRMLDEVAARLDSSSRIQSFPELADGMARGVEAENELVVIRQKLLLAEYEALESTMPQAAKGEWAAHVDTLETLQKKFEQIPANREEMAERDRVVASEFDRLRRRLDRVGYQIDSQIAQVAAVETYLDKQYGRELTAKEEQRVRELKAEVQQQIAELEEAKSQLQHELEMARQQVGMGDPVMKAEAQLRQRYRRALADARNFLAQYHADASGQARQKIERVESVRKKLPPLEARLSGYYDRMNDIVDTKVAELRQDLVVERELIEAHRRSIRQIMTASESGAGVLAYVNFMKARTRFKELILRGDVGIIDVVWRKKEDMTQKINQLFEDRTSELRMLKEAFEEVR